MIIRIVKLSFHPEHVSTFKAIFEESKQKILTQKGCNRVELLQDVNTKNVFFTYSWWNSEDDLNRYRHSELFEEVWAKTKVLFNDKPMAWSTEKIDEAL
jgi:heme-degrading monooxygenase HmoA